MLMVTNSQGTTARTSQKLGTGGGATLGVSSREALALDSDVAECPTAEPVSECSLRRGAVPWRRS